MPSLITLSRQVPDPGTGNAQRHSLLDMLVIAAAALVCGAETCVDFAEFAADRERLLREFLSLENGLPSHDTFSHLSGCGSRRPSGGCLRPFWTVRVPMGRGCWRPVARRCAGRSTARRDARRGMW